jgi:hypothetical protein
VAELQSYALVDDNASLNIEYAVREAEGILAVLQTRDFRSNRTASSDELRAAKNLLELVRALFIDNPLLAVLRQRTDDLWPRLRDLGKHVDDVRRTMFNVGKKSRENEELLKKIRAELNDIYGLESLIKDSYSKAEGVLVKSQAMLKQARIYFLVSDGNGNSFQNLERTILFDIDHRCEDCRFPVSTSCVTISNL